MMANLSTPAERQAFLAGQQAAQEGVSPVRGDSMPATVQSDTAQNNAPLTLAEILPDVRGAEARIVEQQQKAASGTEADKPGVVAQLKNSIPQLAFIQNVAKVNGNELGTPEIKITDRIMNFVASIGGKVNRPGFGDVLFSRSRVKNSMVGHGIGNAKIETFAAVPDVIKNGILIGQEQNWQGRGYDSYVFAAPIDYRGQQSYLGVVVTKDADNRYYVHEVVDGDGNVIYKNNEESPANTSDRRSDLVDGYDTVASTGDFVGSIPQSPENINPLIMNNESKLDYNPLVMQNNPQTPTGFNPLVVQNNGRPQGTGAAR